MGLSHHDEIIVDNQKAQHHTEKYLAAVLLNLNAEGLMITSAMQKFAKFLELPESSSKLGLWWDTAFGIISTLVPAFRWARFLTEQERNVEKAALELAATLGSKKAKFIKLGQKAGEAAERINKAKEFVTKTRENVEGLARPVPEGLAELNKLDDSKKPIHELLESSKKAIGIWSKALDTLDMELEKRLSDLNNRPKESILSMIQRLLTVPNFPTAEELDQIETACLWKMIGSYVNRNVYWLQTRTIIHQMGAISDRMLDGGTETELVGLNDNQQDTILAMFGPKAKRGKYFSIPPIAMIAQALGMWGGVKTIPVTKYSHTVTVSGKM